MKKRNTRNCVCICAWVFISMLPRHANAQFYFYDDTHYDSDLLIELGVSAGGMNCITDLGGKRGTGKKFIKDINWNNTKLCGGFFISAMYKSVIGVRAEASFGKVTAYDSILRNQNTPPTGRYERNLNFRSSIYELALLAEFHPLFLKNYFDDDAPRLSPYIAAGAGLFTFSPQTYYDGRWVNLHPLHTEGQGFAELPERKPYRLTQLNFPVGAGIKYDINHLFNARFEILYRILKTDYLDDASTTYINPSLFYNNLPPGIASLAEKLHDRSGELIAGMKQSPGAIRGDPKDNDAYFSFQVKLAFTLGRGRARM
ncbi:MAG: hypothetical protein SFU87_04320 [Chitinophagaceae bacterium]|nr:hypothetical protein [Chitinophagaceae bacterium]